jgi:GTPase SAR1 family protein
MSSRILRDKNVFGQSRPRTIEELRGSFLVRHGSYNSHFERDTNESVVYDVSNRESFEALPRWYSELETYVSDSVVKILVGNKVDKVRTSVPVSQAFP